MGADFFDRLDRELSQLTRDGAHLGAAQRVRRRRAHLLRRGAMTALVIVALAMSLASEFPAAASGHPRPMPSAVTS